MLRQFIALCLVFCISLAALPESQAGKKVAFLVGVNKYKKPGFRNLSYAERDVVEMSKELKKIGFDVSLILGKDATKSNLDATITKIVRPLSKEDMILVMLTGHGIQRTKGDAYYCPYDAIAESDGSLFSLSKLLNTTLAPHVGTKLVLIDACRNDPDPGRGRSAGIQGKVISLPEDTAVMFSCKSGQQSFENDQLKHGIFTHCLLEGIRGGAKNQNEISWSDLQSFVKRKMASKGVRNFIPKNRFQTPIPAGGVPFTVLARIESVKPMKTLPSSEKSPSKNMVPEANIVGSSSSSNFLVAPFTKEQADKKRKEWSLALKKPITIRSKFGAKFNLIPPGEFEMGSGKDSDELAKMFRSNAFNFDNEFPQHKTRITKPFYISTTEITQKQWYSVMRTAPFNRQAMTKSGSDYPATWLRFREIEEFIAKLNKSKGAKYRLPTEAEWEYVCRAGGIGMYCCGDDEKALKKFAWFNVDGKYIPDMNYPQKVATKLPNNFGLFDLHGNVAEWCSDWFDKDYYSSSPELDPQGPKRATPYRVLRGGSWKDTGKLTRSSQRITDSMSSVYAYYGFRLCMDP